MSGSAACALEVMFISTQRYYGLDILAWVRVKCNYCSLQVVKLMALALGVSSLTAIIHSDQPQYARKTLAMAAQSEKQARTYTATKDNVELKLTITNTFQTAEGLVFDYDVLNRNNQ